MSRVIKFRAWDKDQKRMFDEILGKRLDWLCKEMKLESEEVLRMIAGTFSDYALMQFTGLKDRNGREIYEGDVIDWAGEHRMKIVWSDFGWRAVDKNRVIGESPASIAFASAVIGNIYENPELLNSKEV